MMKVAYTGWTWVTHRGDPEGAKRDVEASFRECKFVGYDYVENFAFIRDFYAENPQELVDLQKKYDVKLVNLYGHFGFDEAAALDTAKKQIEFLAAVGGQWYNCQNAGFGRDGGEPERPTNPEMIDAMVRICDELAAFAKPLGVTICFHPHYGTCVFAQSDIDYFLNKANQDVSFCVDTAHTTLAGIDPAKLVRQLGKRVAFMHLKDVDTYALSKASGREKMGTFRPLGIGNVNFQEVKGALEEVGYDGVLCVELDRPPISNFHAAQLSRQYIKLALGL